MVTQKRPNVKLYVHSLSC